MSKELFISSSPHETKVAVLEDDQLVEVYYQRDTDTGLAGSIYKGRVSRVLPGMQSAFVDIGLGRDAFLYVSDFFEDSEEYDKVLTEAEARVTKFVDEAARGPSAPAETLTPAEASAPAAAVEAAAVDVPSAPPDSEADIGSTSPEPAAAVEPVATAPAVTPSPASGAPAPAAPRTETEGSGYRRYEHRGRRRRRRGRDFGDSKFAPRHEYRERPAERGPSQHGEVPTFEVLPGESLARHSHVTPEGLAETPSERAEEDATSEGPGTAEAPPDLTASGALPDNATETFLAPSGVVPESPVAEVETEEDLEADAEIGTASINFQPDSPPPAVDAVLASSETVEEASETDASASGAAQDESERALELPGGLAPPGEPAASAERPDAAPVAPDTADRTYTLREPQQRPRFAPRRGRRGRGRFNRGRPEAGPGYRPEPSRSGNDQPVPISELLKEGQEILVQIAKEPLGTKGARITSHIALPGRFLVYMPTITHIGVSRKIASEEERLRLRNVILENRGSLTGGFIARTAAAGRSEEDLKSDLKFLSTLWSEIRLKAERSKAPALLHGDLTLVQRILRDTLSPDFKTVRVDSEIEYEHTLEFVSRFQPALVGHVKLYTRDTPMFEEFGIQSEIDKALRPKVWLKSGGYIVINQTEALVAIDVNTGKYVGKTNRLEDTIVKTNIDAVKEIVRQVRLRDLGGIIVIDFIDMDDRRNRFKVVQALEETLRADRAPTKILSINEFGLVALTRKRVKQSLERTLSEPCPYCTGAGWVKSVATVCCEILAEVKKMSSQMEGRMLNLRVNPEVARALKSRDGAMIAELETLSGKDVVVKSDATVHQERFEIF